MNNRTESSDAPIAYVIYDKKTGRPVGRHRQYNAVEGEFEAADESALLSLYQKNEDILSRVSNGDPENLAVMKPAKASFRSFRNMQVKNAQLVARQKLVMFSDKDELEGDGKDSAQLTIMLQDETGKVVTTASDSVLVTTSRGKLSARGGELKLKKGRTSLTLTSVPETVNEVKVKVDVGEGLAEPAELTLAFV
jgi:hypothetical protein